MRPVRGQIRTEAITSLDGTPPKRFVVIAFDSIEKAKAWDASPGQKEVTDIRLKSTNSRSFIADGKSMCALRQVPTRRYPPRVG